MATTRETIDELQNGIQSLRDDFSEIVGTLKAAGERRTAKTAHSISDTAERLGHNIGRSATRARRRAQIAVGEAERAVSDHPTVSVALALGLGAAVGALAHAFLTR